MVNRINKVYPDGMVVWKERDCPILQEYLYVTLRLCSWTVSDEEKTVLQKKQLNLGRQLTQEESRRASAIVLQTCSYDLGF